MRTVDVAYAAGFFDGEGNVSNKYNGDHLQANVAQNERLPLEWLQVLFGGHIYKTGGKRATCYKWAVNGHEAYKFLDVILPFLMVKEAEVKEVMEKWVNRV